MGAELDRLVTVGQMQVVEPNPEQAKSLMHQAELHLIAAESVLALDGVSAYSLFTSRRGRL
jgi:hypothetical protein